MSENKTTVGAPGEKSPTSKLPGDNGKKEEEKGSNRGVRFSGVPHPLDKQNELEREIQLEGSKDPENYKMLDGRTLAEVQKANNTVMEAEGKAEVKLDAKQTKAISEPEYTKTGELVMTKVGNIIDVSEPPPLETEGEASPRQTLPGAPAPKGPEAPAKPPVESVSTPVDTGSKGGTR